MPDRANVDRLQPALLDRLIDDGPDAGAGSGSISRARLRQAVIRDLSWLFNATRIEEGVNLSHVPHVRRSVVNFGLPAFSGTWASALHVGELERAVRDAIVQFEPRILASTLAVQALVERDQLDHHNVIGVEIRGHLWSQPAPVELLLRTEIDLETGTVEVADLLAAGTTSGPAVTWSDALS